MFNLMLPATAYIDSTLEPFHHLIHCQRTDQLFICINDGQAHQVHLLELVQCMLDIIIFMQGCHILRHNILAAKFMHRTRIGTVLCLQNDFLQVIFTDVQQLGMLVQHFLNILRLNRHFLGRRRVLGTAI